MAAVATRAPGMPAAFQPTRVEMRKFGPGAAWAMANRAAKSLSVIQWWMATDWRWISGMTAFAPPNASSDSRLNWTASARRIGQARLTRSAST